MLLFPLPLANEALGCPEQETGLGQEPITGEAGISAKQFDIDCTIRCFCLGEPCLGYESCLSLPSQKAGEVRLFECVVYWCELS